MNDCPLYYVGETVWYSSYPVSFRNKIKCVVLHASYNDNISTDGRFRDRYIIKTINPEDSGYFGLNFIYEGVEYRDVNRCAGEFLMKYNKPMEPIKKLIKYKML